VTQLIEEGGILVDNEYTGYVQFDVSLWSLCVLLVAAWCLVITFSFSVAVFRRKKLVVLSNNTFGFSNQEKTSTMTARGKIIRELGEPASMYPQLSLWIYRLNKLDITCRLVTLRPHPH